MSLLIFLSSGLFLGWSVGANNTGNVFGTAVGSKMVSFKVAATVCSACLVLGALLSGAGTTLTLGKLGSVNEIGGAFIVALAAAIAIFIMTRFKLPVSTSQSIVGAIIGWNFFSGAITDYESLTKIVSSWMIAPVISGSFAVITYILVKKLLSRTKIHLLYLDSYNRIGLIIVGGFGAYSLGANNIANVMGVFVPVAPLRHIDTLFGTISGSEQLFIMGGIAMTVGVFTYSGKVLRTVGNNIMPLTPITAFIVVFSSSMVLFLFSSQSLERFLIMLGLPTIPLVPLASAQTVIGAIIGIGLYQGGKEMNLGVIAKIASAWVTAPVIACIVSLTSLYVIQNVFNQPVYKPVSYQMSYDVEKKLISEGIVFEGMNMLLNHEYKNAVEFQSALKNYAQQINDSGQKRVIELSELRNLTVNIDLIHFEINDGWFTQEQSEILKRLNGQSFKYAWELRDALEADGDDWKLKENTPKGKQINKDINSKFDYICKKFW
ncbi:MAG: anion permease [Leptospirales bacterium]|nr:anion permease [Leptospirales bacterium]